MSTPTPSPPSPSPDLLRRLVGVLDLTTLEGTDTFERVRDLCARGLEPLGDGSATVGAICVYPTMVPAAAEALAGSAVRLASVAGAFPSGMSPLRLRVAEAAWAVEQGANEIDMVISRGEFLAGRTERVVEEVREIRAVIGDASLKIILETGELKTEANIRAASELVVPLLRDGDFIKTSTGKIQPAATLGATAVMLGVLAECWRTGGPKVGLKPAGGVRTADDAMAYWSQAKEIMAGHGDWERPDPRCFRIGASSLLGSLVDALAQGPR
ncbi:MAG: deoxyribose-phosphate aldolase [Phycisphaera sp.]|nr:MAG: deoxyribose-phosphate aldolase [Phycisphaera sp.]